MNAKPIRIAITGAAGQIAYHILFRLANGDLFGKDQPIELRLVDVAQVQETLLKGVMMELEDCNYPLLHKIEMGVDPDEMFEDIDIAILLGGKPRKIGMERKDLIEENGKIFVEHGRALNRVAKKEVKVFVVANPCNTNCLIALHHAPNLNPKNFFAMTKLDENRARYQLAKKADIAIDQLKKVAIWGNHSLTQVDDYTHAHAQGHLITDIIQDEKWLKETFMPLVQKRGGQIIKLRGNSSAASAGNALIDAVRDIYFPSDDWFSTGVYTDNNPYGITNNLIFSFPCMVKEKENYEIIRDIIIDDFILEKISLSEKELIEERDIVKDLIKNKVYL